MSRWLRGLWVGLLGLAAPLGVQAEAVDESKVVALAAAHNPGLKVAMLELDRASWDVAGLSERYAPVLLLDMSGTQTSTPNLFIDRVSLNRTRRADTGAELRKHLLWGTDLSLRVSASYLVTRSNVSFGATPGGRFGPGYGVLAKFTLKQPLLRGRGRAIAEADLNASRLQRTVQEHTRDRIASELLRDALTAYWELWYANAAVRIEEQARELAQRQRDDARARADTGSLPLVEVLTFDTQLATSEESVLEARSLRQERALELSRQLGLIEQGLADLELTEDEPPVGAAPERAEARARALAQASELEALEAQLRLAQVQSKTAADPLRARLDLDSYVQAQGLGNRSVGDAFDQFAGVGPKHALSGFVGLTYEAPLNDRNQRAQAAKARLAVQVAEQQLQQARQQILANVDLSLERIEAQQKKVLLSERTAEIAEQQLKAERARYATGTSTSLSVLEAENAARTARIRTARSRADLRVSMLALQHLTGELLIRFTRR